MLRDAKSLTTKIKNKENMVTAWYSINYNNNNNANLGSAEKLQFLELVLQGLSVTSKAMSHIGYT